MIKAHRIKLNPTPEQEQYFWQAAGVARFAFNWALGEYNRRKEAGEKTVKFRGKGPCLIKDFVTFKNENVPWVNEVTTWAYQGAFADAQVAIRNYFKKKQAGTLNKLAKTKPRKDGNPFGWPRFKSRNKTIPSFYIANTALKFDNHFVRFDKNRVGWIDMFEVLRFEGKVMGARISYRGGHWWLSVQVEVEQLKKSYVTARPGPDIKRADANTTIGIVSQPTFEDQGPNVVGIDLGIKYLAVTSDGVLYDNPKALYKEQQRLRKLQRKLDRQRRANNPDNYNEDGTIKQGIKLEWVTSNKQKRTEQTIIKLHARIANVRNDASHKMTTDIATTYGIIGIEDLNIRGMMQNGKLSKAVADSAMYEKRRQLEYKSAWNGGQVILVDRWFPSSKMCSECKEINTELTLSTRKWTCNNCGKINHRDGNASVNIRNETLRLLSDNQQTVKVRPGSDEKRANVNV